VEEDAVQEELQRVQEAIEPTLSPLQSRWNKEVRIEPFRDMLGNKEFTCEIALDRSLLGSCLRWVVYLHELLHAFSVGYEQAVYYEQFRGWEEGVIEALERLLRPGMIDALGIALDRFALAEIEAYDHLNDYNRYVAALERIRTTLGYREDERQAFYLWLLSVPLRNRSKAVLKSALDLSRPSHPALRKQMLSAIAEADAQLRSL